MTEKPLVGVQNMCPADLGFWTLVAEDYQTHDRQVLSQEFWAFFWHRFGNWRMSVQPRILRAPLGLLYRIVAKLCEIFSPYTVIVGRRVNLEHFGGMIPVAERIGDDVTIRQNTICGIVRQGKPNDRPLIGSSVEIGAGAVLIGSITIGAGAIFGANSVVTRDVMSNTAVGGLSSKNQREGAGIDVHKHG